mmetsp:Transcript_4236/g.16865  ORF Transcript_4236/g.16865 Transcript_4236/m.16865 type:complete len:262 (-) Transcript_4236:586-1371(-)
MGVGTTRSRQRRGRKAFGSRLTRHFFRTTVYNTRAASLSRSADAPRAHPRHSSRFFFLSFFAFFPPLSMTNAEASALLRFLRSSLFFLRPLLGEARRRRGDVVVADVRFPLFLLLPVLRVLLRRDERVFPTLPRRAQRLLLLFEFLRRRASALGILRQKVLAGGDLLVDLALNGRRREHLVLLPLADLRGLLALDVLLLELGQEPVPALVRQRGVLRELALDHQLLDVVDGVHVFHAILDDLAHRLQPFPPAHARHRVPLH